MVMEGSLGFTINFQLQCREKHPLLSLNQMIDDFCCSVIGNLRISSSVFLGARHHQIVHVTLQKRWLKFLFFSQIMPALVPFFPFQLHKEDRELQSNRIIWWICNVWTKLYFEGILLHNDYNCTENASIRIIQSLTSYLHFIHRHHAFNYIFY